MNNNNIDKFLSKTLTTYTFLLVIIFIMKLVGLDYFGLDINNELMKNIAGFLANNRFIRNTIYFIPLLINELVILSITCNDNSKKMKLFILITSPIYYIFECQKGYFGSFSILVELIYFLIMGSIYNKKLEKVLIIRNIKITFSMILVQMISVFTRFRYSIEYVNNIIANLILNLDYIIMLIMIYKIYFMKGGQKLWIYLEDQFLSSQKKIHLRKLLKQLQRSLDNFKKKSKVEKLEISIYIILSLIWNTLSVVLILFVAKLNDTFVECIFILTSFWLSKTTFGKPFHFSKMSTCFIVSNLTYYALNRITTPLGISIIVPIILGVGLSYVTSKFVKPSTTKLYKGMPEEEFNNSILNVTDKDSLQYKICHMFYVERKSELEIAHNVGYSIDNIKKIKSKINKKIKELS